MKPDQCFKKNAVLLLGAILLLLPVLTGEPAAAATKRFVATDQTVKDVKTGLEWSRDANPAGRSLSWDAAADYVRMLNKQKYAGHADWRIPEIGELVKLWDAAKEAGGADALAGGDFVTMLTGLGFLHVQDGDYWSSSASLYNESDAWFMSMKQGVKSSGNKSLYLSVWPVRFEKK